MPSQRLQLQRAEARYREFHNYLSASQAYNGYRDPIPLPIPIEVTRQAVLDCFLARNPQFDQFRAHLAEFRREIFPTVFHLAKDRWEAVSKNT